MRSLAALGVGPEAQDRHRLSPRHVGTRAHPNRAHANRESRLLKRKKADKVLLKGEGLATFYYEKEGPGGLAGFAWPSSSLQPHCASLCALQESVGQSM